MDGWVDEMEIDKGKMVLTYYGIGDYLYFQGLLAM